MTDATGRGDTSTHANDEARMAEAVGVAASARLVARPNPWVGAVAVAPDGRTARGATAAPGGPHAEVAALAALGDARGATLYCTLEPCVHVGRTGPCTDAILAAGVARVVVGIEDPDARVRGRGIARLREAGLEVVVGVRADEVAAQLAPYLHHRRTGRPYVVAKMAATLDGRTADAAGASRWITGGVARRRGHALRAESDAVLVGAGTVRADDPELTTRDAEGPSPRRVVLGSAPVGARVHPCTEWRGEIEPLLDRLGAEGVLQLLVEGGARTLGAFHARGLVDRYVLHLAPALMGGRDGAPLVDAGASRTMADLWRGRLVSASTLGDDVEIVVEPAGVAT
jgi:diaminohydroxyphosphoribosylaminopyrimidine deaminase/5-amino-6-(5-phosphoribosylamino)uracil reductase